MSNMKRPAQDGEAEGQRRKSQRISAPPQRLGFASDHDSEGHRQPSEQRVTKHDLLEEQPHFRKECRTINKGLQGHNNLLAFLDGDFRPSKSFIISQQRVRDYGAQADQIVRDAELQIQKIQARMEEKYAEIVRSVYSNVLPAIYEKPYWWETGNIFSLSFSQIRQTDFFGAPDDAARFVNYLYPLMNTYLEARAEKHEEPSADFMDTVDLLHALLKRSENPAVGSHCFRFGLYLLLHAMPESPIEHWSSRMVTKFALLRSYLRSCLTGYVKLGMRRMETARHDYLDAATAFQDLMRAHNSHECEDEDGDPWYSRQSCFHRRHISLLDDVLGRAHREVRDNAFLAVSGRLPVELADVVAEHSIAANNLPSYSTVLEYPQGHNPDPLQPGQKLDTMLRSRYWCDHMISYPSVT